MIIGVFGVNPSQLVREIFIPLINGAIKKRIYNTMHGIMKIVK